ncbi:MAG TPA: DUF2066 domain-containing protein [Geminicoccaceae bacterium]|nr:DUF2066 domain-containing protein [Geminicoccus sp.]HMU49346.1 DUF2066 domain-containing protein [Geminicoccaceae bacterium]
MRPTRSASVLWGLLLAALASMAPGSAGAATTDPFRVETISVDASAENAVAARAAAIEQGQREGLGVVFARLTAPGAVASLPDPASVDLDRAVRSYDVADEQVASNRYVATINVNYNPAEIRRLLSGQGVAFVQRPPAPVLVLPVLESPAGTSLWGDDDPWRQAWMARGGESGRLLDLLLPLGDVEDLAAFPPTALQADDTAALAGLAARYEASAAYVVKAYLPSGEVADGSPVRVDVLGPRLGQPLASQVVQAGPGVSASESLAPVVTAAVAALEAAWKTQNLGASGRSSKLSMDVPLADLRGWVQIRRELETLPLVRSLRIDSLDRAQASLTIDYLGELQQFESAVAGLGMMLEQENDRWRLLPAGGRVGIEAPAPAATPPL